MAVKDKCVYAACAGNGLWIIDIIDPENPSIINTIETTDEIITFGFIFNYIYLITNKSPCFILYDLCYLPSIKKVNTFGIPFNASDAFACPADSIVYITCGSHVYELSVNNLKDIFINHIIGLENNISKIVVFKEMMYLFGIKGDYAVYDLKEKRIIHTANLEGCSKIVDVQIFNNMLVVLDKNKLLFLEPLKRNKMNIINSMDIFEDAKDVHLAGNYGYIADYSAGMKIINIRDLNKLVLESNYQTEDFSICSELQEEYIYLGNGNELKILRITDQRYPELISSVTINGGSIWSVQIKDNYLYVVSIDSGLYIVDVSDKKNTEIIGSYKLTGNTNSVYLDGEYAYLVNSSSGLHILNISIPENPVLIGTYTNSDKMFWCSVKYNGYLLLCGFYEVTVLDITDLTNPISVGSCLTKDSANDIVIKEHNAYIAGDKGFYVLNLTNPLKPVISGSLDTGDIGRSICCNGNYIFLANNKNGLKIIRIDGNNEFEVIESYNSSYNLDVTCSDQFLVHSEGRNGISIYKLK
jgi:hypothetical protein